MQQQAMKLLTWPAEQQRWPKCLGLNALFWGFKAQVHCFTDILITSIDAENLPQKTIEWLYVRLNFCLEGFYQTPK